MVEMLQAAVVEWQAVVDAAEVGPPEARQPAASAGEEEQISVSQSPVVGTNAGGTKAPGPQKEDGRRQRKKRGASSTAAVSIPGEEALGAFDALHALQSEQGWDEQHNPTSGGGEGDGSGSSEAAPTPLATADQGSATRSALQVLADEQLAENAKEEVETPRDRPVGGHRDASGENSGEKLTDVRDSQDILEEGDEDEDEDEDEGYKGALLAGGLRSSRVSASDLGAIGNSLEEGEEEED